MILNKNVTLIQGPPEGGSNLRKCLDEVIQAGFKPTYVTTQICEETFVFETEEEANNCWKKFNPDFFMYEEKEFEQAHAEHPTRFYDRDGMLPSIVYKLK